MKIIHVINGLGAGGAEMVVHSLCENQSDSNTIVYNIGPKEEFLNRFLISNITVINGYRGKTVINKLRSLIDFLFFISSKNEAVLHAHMYHALVFSLLAKCLTKQKKVIFTSHNYKIKGTKFRTWLIRISKKLRDKDVLFSNTQYSKIYRKDFVIIPNGINIKKELLTNSRKQWHKDDIIKVLMIGRLEPVKNHRLAMDIISEIDNSNLELHLVGDGFLKQDLKDYADKLSISERVFFHGLQKDISPYLNFCNVLFITSHWEGLPISLLEAGSHAMPIVSSNVGSIGELICDESLGCVREHRELSIGLRNILFNAEESLKKGKKLQQRIFEFYNIEQIRKTYRDIYESA